MIISADGIIDPHIPGIGFGGTEQLTVCSSVSHSPSWLIDEQCSGISGVHGLWI